MENNAVSVVTGHGICRIRRTALVQALRWKARFGGEIGRGVHAIRTVKQDYPELKGRTAAELLAGLEAMDATRCHCDEGRKSPTDPVYIYNA